MTSTPYITMERKPPHSYTVLIDTLSFSVSISDNIEPAVCRNTDHRFAMTTFEKPTTCNHCSKFLKGRIFQVSFFKINSFSLMKIVMMFCEKLPEYTICVISPPQGYRCERCLIACHKPCIPFSGRCGLKPPPELPPRPPLLNPRHESDPNAINHTIQVIYLNSIPINTKVTRLTIPPLFLSYLNLCPW